MKKIHLLVCLVVISVTTSAQNVGIGTATPAGKLHVIGSANATQLIIDANSTQSNTNPLIKLRKSDGTDLMWIHSDDATNSFVGLNAGRVNDAVDGGYYNTFIGSGAGYSNISGAYNTANGYHALYSNTTGYSNTANGLNALYSNTGGYWNTAIGESALRDNNIGYSNTAIGMGALVNNHGGYGNTAIGLSALGNNHEGGYNIAIGYDAHNDLSSSSNNTLIGTGAHCSASNSVVIGFNSFTNTNNLALLGNPSTLFTGGYTPWSNFSDGRFKKNVKENVKGLDFILRLRPVTYQMDVQGLYNFWGTSPYGNDKMKADKKSVAFIDEAIRKKEAVVMTGFVAQEVEKAAKECDYNFDGVIRPQHDKDHYRIAYEEFVVPLVKAVQELSEQITAQNKIIEQQQNKIVQQQQQYQNLLKRVETLEKK